MIINGLYSAGRERRFFELMKQFHHHDELEIHILVLKKVEHFKEIFDLKHTCKVLNYDKALRDPKLIFDIISEVKRFKPDFIHCWSAITSFLTIPTHIVTGIPIINSMISNAPTKLSLKVKFLSRISAVFSKIVLANSYAGIRAYALNSNKVFCIHNGFDMSRANNLTPETTIRERLELPDKKILGMVGTVDSRKDHPTLIKAAEIILTNRNDVVFLIVGGGSQLEETKSKVQNKFRNDIIFTGVQSDVESIVNTFYAGLLITHTEGISNSVMEYMSLQKPVIATDGGGTNELVIDGETGYLIRHGDYKGLVDKINFVLDNEGTAQTLGMNGFDYLKREFSIDVMKNSFLNVYKKMLE